MTIPLVQNLLLTSKQKIRFGLARPGQARPMRKLLFWSQREVLNKWNGHSVLPLFTKMELLFWCQRKMGLKVISHPVFYNHVYFTCSTSSLVTILLPLMFKLLITYLQWNKWRILNKTEVAPWGPKLHSYCTVWLAEFDTFYGQNYRMFFSAIHATNLIIS